MSPTIVAADTRWIWMTKPAGLPVFPPHADPSGACLLRWLTAARPERVQIDFPSGFAGGIAHRLDTSTSGLVLAARTPDDLATARAAFAARALTKRYRFLSAGRVPWRAHRVQVALAHHRRRKGRMVCQRGKSTPHRGKWYPADTRFTRLDTNLWEAVIVTGVMHQIRAHAAFVGIALLGDRRYGGAPLPAGFAPPGVTFALHHHEMEGLVTPAPRLATPDWWGGLRAARSLTR